METTSAASAGAASLSGFPLTGNSANPAQPQRTSTSSASARRAPLPTSSQAPRLYAPLLSMLNPIEDSSLATQATPAEDNHRADTQEATLQDASARAAAAAAICTTVGAGRSVSPSTEPRTTSSATRDSWWSTWTRVWREMRAACAREVLPIDQPRLFSASERAKMARYESVDTYEPESMLYKDYLETRSHEPRWFMWVFVLILGVSTSALSLGTAACLHVLNAVRYELLGFGLRGFSFADAHRYANSTVAGSSLDVWAMLKGRNVGLYGLDGPLAYGSGYLLVLLFALCTSALASAVCYLVPESVGSGIPEVRAYLNGVSYPMMRSTRVLVARMVAVVLTVSSGVCTGHYGHLMLAGAMLGAQLLQRRHGIRCYHVHFVDCFRNPRDRRVILVIGAAAGMASAFCVSVAGLLVILELLSAVFPVRFALYVFAACLLSTLCTQVYLSYWVNFDTRYRPSGGLQRGELLSEAVVLFRTHLPFGQHPAMNLMDFVAAFGIGLCTGACAVVFVRVSWAALYLRRRLEVALRSKAIRYALPILFTLVYVSLHYWMAVACTYEPLRPSGSDSSSSGGGGSASGNGATRFSDTNSPAHLPIPVVCKGVPYAVRSGRNVTTISFYGMNGFLCPAVDMKGEDASGPALSRESTTTATTDGDGAAASAVQASSSSARTPAVASQKRRNRLTDEQSVRVMDTYASLAFSYADSALQTLLSQRTAGLMPWRALGTFTLLYFFSSAVYSGLALCGDTLLPSLVIGAALGRCVGTVVHVAATCVLPSASSWADPGVFALFGAGSFVSATSGLSFGIGAILIESTADFRHLLPLMFAIVVARRVLTRWSRDMLTVYLEARAVPLLNAEPYLDRFTLLDARHVMHGPVVALPVVCSLEDITSVLRRTTHHGFPVVSAHDGTCKGIVTRAQLELMLWHLIMTQGRVSHCTYDVLQRVEDHGFHNHCEGRDPTEFLPPSRQPRPTQMSLYPHVDTSAFTVLDTTALSCVYDMFTTLGLRHLIVVDRSNYAVGVITRKDLTGDHLSRVQTEEDRRRAPPRTGNGQGNGGGASSSAVTARDAAFAAMRAPLHPTAAQVAEVARTSSTRRLYDQQQQQQQQ
ncbi:putative chloride channel protein [Leptomonas pyrrhocoris]|uniref:Chloride channel protein n=1 Tax=Leptomonas pyrrhocoris TaxID=157538 RepID=A0A0N0DSZ1_LEPPY|nr:putative chloride channel protein [Leptomonas pyrrhocoris]KPA76661.1 putative chloride channel protein [Leptomonas pyrrhocoris]|eukprot:XP_015655100.1 putative chloride channel protein [Leptomonas pyrrhocoris]